MKQEKDHLQKSKVEKDIVVKSHTLEMVRLSRYGKKKSRRGRKHRRHGTAQDIAQDKVLRGTIARTVIKHALPASIAPFADLALGMQGYGRRKRRHGIKGTPFIGAFGKRRHGFFDVLESVGRAPGALTRGLVGGVTGQK
jgi:hypothetical protein